MKFPIEKETVLVSTILPCLSYLSIFLGSFAKGYKFASFIDIFVLLKCLFSDINNGTMDVNWKESLNRMVDLHMHAIEHQINESVSLLQTSDIPLSRDRICYFFDTLYNR